MTFDVRDPTFHEIIDPKAEFEAIATGLRRSPRATPFGTPPTTT